MNTNVKRIILSVMGVLVGGISVGIFKLAAFGVDPFQSLMSGLDELIPIPFGTLYVIVNLLLLSFSLIVDRSKIGRAGFARIGDDLRQVGLVTSAGDPSETRDLERSGMQIVYA